MPPMPNDMPSIQQLNDVSMDDSMNDPMANDDMGDEVSDPKKSIQQLVGKLSQELRTYNDNQEGQDIDLNKYVAGMIIPQATKVMTDQDKDEVIDKIQKGLTDDESTNDTKVNDGMPMDDEPIVNEVINSLVNDKKESRFEKHIKNNDVKSRQNPFKTNR